MHRHSTQIDGQPCWVCGSANTRVWKNRNLPRKLVPEDFKITDSRYGVTLTLLRCGDCGFNFASRDEVDGLVSLYEQLEDPDYEQGIDTRSLQMRWLIASGMKRHRGATSLLEVGSGIGLLIKEARKAGLDAIGVEPSRSLVAAAERMNGVKILQGIYPHPELIGRRFDLVYVVDVIEHVDHPVDLLKSCREALNADSHMVVVTPDISSAAARALGKRWWHLRLAHVGYFDGTSMERAAQAAGLRVVHTERAVWFFPVRYLLERLAVYFPIAGLNRWSDRNPLLRRLYERTLRVNLHDSTVFFLQRT